MELKLAAKGSASFPRLGEFTRSNEGEEGEESMHELGEEGGEDKLDARAGLCARYMEKEKKNIPDVFCYKWSRSHVCRACFSIPMDFRKSTAQNRV